MSGLRPQPLGASVCKDDGAPQAGPLPALLYRFGFLCCRAGAAPPPFPTADWRPHSIAGFALWTHRETRIALHHRGDACFVFLGDVYVESGADLPTRLAHVDPQNETALADLMDDLSGRFALILVQGADCRVFHDPIGSQAVFYHAREPFAVASHPGLLAAAVGAARCPEMAGYMRNPAYHNRQVRYLPGDATAFAQVHALVPNTLFDSATDATRRYWPRAPRGRTRLPEFLDMADRAFAGQIGFLSQRYRPVFGLTGGVDTRAAIAAYHRAGVPFAMMTWRSRTADPGEMAVVARLAALIRQPHRFIDLHRTELGAVSAVAALNAGSIRFSSRLAEALHAVYGAEPDRAFLRCWGGEVLRGFYNLRPRPMRTPDPEEMTRAYLLGETVGARHHARTLAAFEGFCARAHCAELDGLGYDPNDIFYWEHRMGMWGAISHLEIDPAIRSLTGFNSRRLFAAALGLPRRQRLSKRLLLRVTHRQMPALAQIPLAPANRENAVTLRERLAARMRRLTRCAGRRVRRMPGR